VEHWAYGSMPIEYGDADASRCRIISSAGVKEDLRDHWILRAVLCFPNDNMKCDCEYHTSDSEDPMADPCVVAPTLKRRVLMLLSCRSVRYGCCCWSLY